MKPKALRHREKRASSHHLGQYRWLMRLWLAGFIILFTPHLQVFKVTQFIRHFREQIAGDLQPLQICQLADRRWQLGDAVSSKCELLQQARSIVDDNHAALLILATRLAHTAP